MVVGGCRYGLGGVGKDGVLFVLPLPLARATEMGEGEKNWAKVTRRPQACGMGVKGWTGVYRGREEDFEWLQGL